MTSNTDSATNNSISVSTSISAHQSELSSNNISASQNLTNPPRSNQTRANKRLPKAGVLIGYERQWGLGFVTMAGFVLWLKNKQKHKRETYKNKIPR